MRLSPNLSSHKCVCVGWVHNLIELDGRTVVGCPQLTFKLCSCISVTNEHSPGTTVQFSLLQKVQGLLLHALEEGLSVVSHLCLAARGWHIHQVCIHCLVLTLRVWKGVSRLHE